MLKKIGDTGRIHSSLMDTGMSEHYLYVFNVWDVSKHIGKGGFRFNNKEALEKFLLKNPHVTFNPHGMFMIIDKYEDDVEYDDNFFIVEYDGYAYSILRSELKFMALYDKNACDFFRKVS